MYTELFDCVCNQNGSSLDETNGSAARIDTAVFMIWDMGGGIDGPSLFPWSEPWLVEPSYRILKAALFECRSSSCWMSALHALGHFQMEHGASQDLLPEHVHTIIDRFLALPNQPVFVREYARDAREGRVR